MKLYKIEYARRGVNGTETGTGTAWCGTQAEAKAREKELEHEHGRWRVGNIEQVEVPTDKPGLLAWLNEHAA